MSHKTSPTPGGDRIQNGPDGLRVPHRPVVPFIRGDGSGPFVGSSLTWDDATHLRVRTSPGAPNPPRTGDYVQTGGDVRAADVVGLASATMYMTLYAINSWGVLYLQEAKGYTLMQAGGAISINTIAGILGAVAFGFTSDKVFNARRPPTNVIFAAMEIIGLLMVFFGPPGKPLFMTVAFFIYGFGLTGLVTSLGGLFALDIAPKRAAGAAMGFIGGIIGASAGVLVIVAVSANKEWTPVLDVQVPLLAPFAGLGDSLRILVSVVLIAPLAFFMGLPFPLGITRVGQRTPELIPWAWGINGCASVISAVLATLLAMHFGFTVVVVSAVLLYGVAAVSLPR